MLPTIGSSSLRSATGLCGFVLLVVMANVGVNGFKAQNNVYGRPLEVCSLNPLTGWFRDGYARTDDNDHGTHTVCAMMTPEFLAFTKSRGNDLSTPRGSFPGLKPGNYWSLCAVRWLEAERNGKAPLVKMAATNEKALTIIPMNILEKYDESIGRSP